MSIVMCWVLVLIDDILLHHDAVDIAAMSSCESRNGQRKRWIFFYT